MNSFTTPENPFLPPEEPIPPKGGNGFAITSLVCGIIGMLGCGLTAIPGLIFGIIVLVQGRAGKGLAIAGVITSSLGLVIVPIAIIAAIAIPNLLESRITANEAAAAATLKSGFFPAQVTFQGGGYRDQDKDGRGESGTLAEFAGEPIPGVDRPLTLLDPRFISEAPKNGYLFRIYVPTGVGSATSDGAIAAKAAKADPKACDLQESCWVGYAWPVDQSMGRRIFAITANGQIFTQRMESRTSMEDLIEEPKWHSLFSSEEWSETARIDSSRWVPYSR